MSNSILDYNYPLQTIDTYVPGARDTPHQGGTVFFNLWMSQNQNGPIAFDTLFKQFTNSGRKIGRIIEIGTAHGGLAVLFGLFARAYGCEFITYDIADTPDYKDLFSRLSVDFRLQDVFADKDRLEKDIQKEGATILFCDGGNKIREFNEFALYLKAGDIIVAHDYSKDAEYYDSISHNNIWSFFEIDYASIQKAVESEKLEPILSDVFSKAAMCAFVKT